MKLLLQLFVLIVMQFNRRDFLGIVTVLSGTATLAAACGGSNPDDPTSDASRNANRCATTIGSNHGHELAITQDDARAGAAATASTTLHIQGSSSHDHTITLTPADYQKLLAGETVSTVSSSSLAHTHVVTVSC